MKIINLPQSTSYQSLYDLSGYEAPDSLIVTNNTTEILFLKQQATQPDDDDVGISSIHTIRA